MATETTSPEVADASGATGPGLFRRRLVGMALWACGFLAIWWYKGGLPTDPIVAFVCLWGVTIAWNSHRPWTTHLRFARDWLPIVLLLVLYGFSRGAADDGGTPHVQELIDADRALFGGHVPTIWLQERFYDPLRVQWYDVAASIVYLSHFVVTLTVAVVLWLRARSLWAAFMRRWLGLIGLGLVTYFLYPAAPPWWASEFGYLSEHVERTSAKGWSAIGLDLAGNLLDTGQAMSNPVAAMPSLHTAFSVSVVAFFLNRVRRRWIPLLLAYPLAMTLTLVYTGEHYVVDAIAGAVYVCVVYALVGLGERWWRRRRERRADEADPPATREPAVAVTPR
ncbi:MAG TPA: phosphatase PAP2 family protein [Cryptosporangiaceae bacterium]|nr:phosphatase PAP2 family protein [Cryptosporangiaceae bacterium]